MTAGAADSAPDRLAAAGAGRDRDDSGRPRNARRRDASGRPLPRDAAGGEPVRDDVVRTPQETLCTASGLIEADRPFAAHEVLEAAWKAAADDERALWQGLAQVAVGLTHAQRGNARGAAALLRRGAGQLEDYAERPPYGIDVAGVLERACAVAACVERDGLATIEPEDLRVRLTRCH